jgi:hypothetical protein
LGRLDILCGILSVIGLLLWLVTKVGNLAIFFSVLADALASAPTIVKSYKEPASEEALVYWAGAILGGLTLLTIKQWTFSEYAYPAYILLMNLVIVGFINSRFFSFFLPALKPRKRKNSKR